MPSRRAVGAVVARLRGLRGASVDARPTDGADALMLRALCHELRTPISALTSLTRALTDDSRRFTAQDRQALLRLARDQAAHLDGVWQQAAALARDATTGDDGARIPLTQVLHAVLATVPSERARLHLSPRAADRLVDGQRVRQILINLVDNALRHGPAGGQVSISARIPADDLVIVVADEGTSCAAVRAMLRRREPSAGMSGLGLWIVGCLVAAQGGRVRAYPLRPRGVAVEVVLRHGPRGGRVRRWPRWAAGWPRRASEMGMSLVSAIRHRGGHHVQSRQGPAVRGQAGRP